MNLKISSKHQNVKSLLPNSTTSHLLCVCEQRESRLRKGRSRKIRGPCQFSQLCFYAPQAHATFWMLKNSLCWWTQTIPDTALHGNWMNMLHWKWCKNKNRTCRYFSRYLHIPNPQCKKTDWRNKYTLNRSHLGQDYSIAKVKVLVDKEGALGILKTGKNIRTNCWLW